MAWLLLLTRRMTGTGVYRGIARERCSECSATSTGRCPRCNRAVCALHGVPPESLCAACAEHELARVSRAGGGVMSIAFVTSGIAAGLTYALVELGVVGAFLWIGVGLAVAVTAFLVVAGLASRPLQRRRVRRERQLPSAEREKRERHARERANASRLPQIAR